MKMMKKGVIAGGMRGDGFMKSQWACVGVLSTAGREAEGVGPAAGAERPPEGAVGRGARPRAQRQGGLCPAGIPSPPPKHTPHHHQNLNQANEIRPGSKGEERVYSLVS